MVDQTDMRILTLLADNARASAEDIAVMLGMEVEEVRASIERLEAERVIVKYGAMIDWERAGDETVQALIEVRITPQRDMGFDSIAARIYRFDEVKSCYLMSGGYDLTVFVEAQSMKQLAYFVAEKLSVIENVLSCATHFVLRKYKVDGIELIEEPKADRRQVVT